MSDEQDIQQKMFIHPDGESFTIGDGGAHLSLTEERLIKAKANQERWAHLTASPFNQVSPQMASYLRAVRELPGLLERTEPRGLSVPLSSQIAENYAIQGDYQTALRYAIPSQRKLFQMMSHAIERSDDEDCGPECEAKFKANSALLTRYTLAGWQWDPRYSNILPVIRCAICGELNVRPLPETLARQMNARARARELTKDLTHEQAKATLTNAGLTPSKVFNS